MDQKTLKTLEFNKVLEQLAKHASFSASLDKIIHLKPTSNIHTARRWLAQTEEARQLLDSHPLTTVGGARDIRPLTEDASRGMVLSASNLLDIKTTLISMRLIARILEKNSQLFPHLWEISLRVPAPFGLVDAISNSISEKGEVLSSASASLGKIRSEIQISHDRLLARMEKLLSSSKYGPHLQEAIITQRDGRYVLPIKAEAKGRLKAVVHDTSSSGATLFVEPVEVVELNNDYRELQIAEKEEIRKVLAALTSRVGQQAQELSAGVEALAELDLQFAKAKYAEKLKATQPELLELKPQKGTNSPGLTLVLYQARHPLLDPETVVPIDLTLDADTYALLITGPNTGGKTVSLKTAGLLALMAQAGLHIPAQRGSRLSVFKDVYADIGDEQSIEQSLSTFSGHITNIVKILDRASPQSLVIFDELGAGTDPQEGAALAQAILSYMLDSGIPTLVATHYPELKAYAHAHKGVINASMEFNMESLRPTYHLLLGLPGRSNALAIAQRLGLQAAIVEKARAKIDPTELKAEDLLNEIHQQHDLTRKARAAAEKAQKESDALRMQLARRLENIENERLAILKASQETTQNEVAELKDQVRQAKKQLQRARQPLDVIEQVEEQLEVLTEQTQIPIERQEVSEKLPSSIKRPIQLGDKVLLRSLGKEGVVTTLGEEIAEVQIGNLRIRAELYTLDLISGPTQKPVEAAAPRGDFKVKSPGLELSLRGKTVDESLDLLDAYLDRAYVAGLPFVRIVHGKGTGKLRDAVRNALRAHSHISGFEPGGPSEGGDGVTVVHLRSD